MQKVSALLKSRHTKTEETSEECVGNVEKAQKKLCALVLPKCSIHTDVHHESSGQVKNTSQYIKHTE